MNTLPLVYHFLRHWTIPPSYLGPGIIDNSSWVLSSFPTPWPNYYTRSFYAHVVVWMRKAPQRFTYLNSWFPPRAAVLGGCATFRSWRKYVPGDGLWGFGGWPHFLFSFYFLHVAENVTNQLPAPALPACFPCLLPCIPCYDELLSLWSLSQIKPFSLPRCFIMRFYHKREVTNTT